MGFFNWTKEKKPELEDGPLPSHIAIIMDGNGRWAKKRSLPRTAGHKVGAEVFKKTAKYMRDVGIKYFTVYAFSTENWKRPEEEVGIIFTLLIEYLKDIYGQLTQERMKIEFIGDTTRMPQSVQEEIERCLKTNPEDYDLSINIALNYGGRAEITRAAALAAERLKSGEIDEITEEEIERGLYTAGKPDPDLIIRTSGEMRLSNFLSWQSAYSEFYFTDVLWPDFSPKDVDEAIMFYRSRNRRFGGI